MLFEMLPTSTMLRCVIGNLHPTYIGLPFGASFKSMVVWDVVK